MIKWESELPTSLSPEDFRDVVLEKLNVEVNDQELVTVLRHCNEPETADIRLTQVCEYIRSPPPPPQRELKPGDPMPTAH